ncbi:MAG: hypothetical protein WCI74_17115, partial [Actinomycetes bacterium]
YTHSIRTNLLIISVIVGSSLMRTGNAPESGANVAAVVPMSASGTHYKQASLSSQIAGQLRRWRTVEAGSPSSAPSESASAGPAVGASSNPGPSESAKPTPSGSTSPVISTTTNTTDPSGTVIVTDSGAPITDSVRRAVTSCVQSLGAGDPMHVDIGMYRESEQGAELQVAVVAVPAGDNFVEIYVVNVSCTNPQQVLVHLHVPSN